MNNAWSVEFSRILVVVITILLLGFVSGEWTISVLAPFSVYVGWMLVQIRGLERWIRLGTKNSMALDSSGIWQLIVQRIVQAQRKNRARKKRLSELARRFEAIIVALPDATVVINAEREIELTNQAAFEFLGIDKNRDLGQKIDNLIRDPRFLQLIEESQPASNVELESPRDRRKTLSVTCVEFGRRQKLITARDVSQRIAVQKLRKAFIANASHELRTPLTVIAGYLELLSTEPAISDRVKKQVDNASQQAVRMQKILDDLLLLSKLEEKGFNKLSGEVVPMATVVEELVSDFSKTRAKDTHQIEVSADSSLQIKAIEEELYSLCQNLLSNAVKYSPEGSTIKVKWYLSNEGEPIFSVTDNGEGIAPENISRLTERFFRVNVKRSRQVGGTGLGLSIVKHILENNGGHLDIKSQLGRGSEFKACFPKYRAVHLTAEKA